MYSHQGPVGGFVRDSAGRIRFGGTNLPTKPGHDEANAASLHLVESPHRWGAGGDRSTLPASSAVQEGYCKYPMRWLSLLKNRLHFPIVTVICSGLKVFDSINTESIRIVRHKSADYFLYAFFIDG